MESTSPSGGPHCGGRCCIAGRAPAVPPPERRRPVVRRRPSANRSRRTNRTARAGSESAAERRRRTATRPARTIRRSQSPRRRARPANSAVARSIRSARSDGSILHATARPPGETPRQAQPRGQGRAKAKASPGASSRRTPPHRLCSECAARPGRREDGSDFRSRGRPSADGPRRGQPWEASVHGPPARHAPPTRADSPDSGCGGRPGPHPAPRGGGTSDSAASRRPRLPGNLRRSTLRCGSFPAINGPRRCATRFASGCPERRPTEARTPRESRPAAHFVRSG